MEEGKLKAVHDDDLGKLLKSLKCLDSVNDGDEKCFFCQKTITLENILAVFPNERTVCFCCTEEECYKALLERGQRVVE